MSDLPNTPTPPPAPLTPEQIKEWLDFQLEPMIRQRDDEVLPALKNTIATHPRIEDGDEDTASKFTDNIRIARALAGSSSSLSRRNHGDHKRPYIDGGRAVDGWFSAFDIPIADAIARLTAALLDYQQRKDAAARRKADEEAAAARELARKRDEDAAVARAQQGVFSQEAEEQQRLADAARMQAQQAEREAAAKPAESRTRGMYGGTASIRQTWEWVVVDLSKVPRRLMMINPDAVKAEVLAKGREPGTNKPLAVIPGVEFRAKQALNVR